MFPSMIRILAVLLICVPAQIYHNVCISNFWECLAVHMQQTICLAVDMLSVFDPAQIVRILFGVWRGLCRGKYVWYGLFCNLLDIYMFISTYFHVVLLICVTAQFYHNVCMTNFWGCLIVHLQQTICLAMDILYLVECNC